MKTNPHAGYENIPGLERIPPEHLESISASVSGEAAKSVAYSASSLRALLGKYVKDTSGTDTSAGAAHYDKYLPYTHVCLFLSSPLEILRIGSAALAARSGRVSLLIPSLDGLMCHIALHIGIDDVYVCRDITSALAFASSKENPIAVDKFVCSSRDIKPGDVMPLRIAGIDVDVLSEGHTTVFITDDTSCTHWIAADALAILCRGAYDTAYVVSISQDSLKGVRQAVETLKGFVPEARMDARLMKRLRTVCAVSREAAASICDRIRPQRLVISAENPDWYAGKITGATSVFLDAGFAKSAGDYLGTIEPSWRVREVALTGITAADFQRCIHYHRGGLQDSAGAVAPAYMLPLTEISDKSSADDIAIKMRMISTISKNNEDI